MTVLRHGSATDVGRVRSVNEDRLLVGDGLFAVADGLGGHQAGEVASKTAVETLAAQFTERTVEGLETAAQAANRAVWQLAQDDRRLQGMATTLTAVALVTDGDEEELAVINVGDSRAYLLQRNELIQLTEDHSLVEQMVREGRLTSQEAAVHPQRSIITRALGLEPEVEIDVWQLIPYRGDRLLLCTDGLTNEVDDDGIASILRTISGPEEAARKLVAQAKEHGGSDNITVVVLDVEDDDERAERASAALAEAPGTDGPGGNRPTEAKATSVETLSPNRAAAARTEPAPWDAPTNQPVSPPAAPAATGTEDGPSSVTWRVTLFVLGLVAIAAVAVAAIGWYARSTYYVGFDAGQVVIFKGRPGGLLWFKPSIEQRTPMRAQDVPPSRSEDLNAGHSEPDLADAQRYVTNLRQEAERLKPPPPPPSEPIAPVPTSAP